MKKAKNSPMKNTLVCFTILVLFNFSVKGQITQSGGGTVWETNPSSEISLNGNWQFKYISGSSWSGYSTFYTNTYDASTWGQLTVPSNWEMKGVNSSQYVVPPDAVGLYRTNFTIPSAWADSNVYIRLDGVLMGYELWVNENYVGNWESAYNSRQFNITPFLQSGNNLLAIRVYTRYSGYEFDTHDDWGVSGIFRDVTIFPVSEEHLNFFKTESKITSGTNVDLAIKYAVSKFGTGSLSNIDLQIKLYDPSDNLLNSFTNNITEIMQGASDTLKQSISIPNASLWTAETPSLYKVEIILLKNTIPIQTFERKVGLREIKIVNKQVLLNNTVVKLRGVNYHETDPYLGKALNRQHRLKDLLMMKGANINYIRTAHYPPHSDFFNLCDSLGFYVTCEVPFGFGDNYLNDLTYKLPLLNRADATVSRHQNHPCVIIWSIGNENEITPMTADVGLHVKQIDSTRLICYPQAGGMFYWRDYNNYPAHIDIFAPHYPDVATLNYYITKVNRPLLITEISHSLGSAFEDHDKLWEIIQQNNVTAGCAVWDWADQAIARTGSRTDNYTKTNDIWLNSTNYFYMNGNQGADGIVYADRTPQSDYWEVQKNYVQVRVGEMEIPVVQGNQTINIQISNRYDFVNLQSVINCQWYLTKDKDTIQTGSFIPNCNPGQNISPSISVNIVSNPSLNIYLLHLNFKNNSNQTLNNHTIRLLPVNGIKPDLMALLSDAAIISKPILSNASDSIKVAAVSYYFAMSTFDGMLKLDNSINLIQEGPFIRTGKRASMAEENAIPGKLLTKYIMNNSKYTPASSATNMDTVSISGSYLFDNNNIKMQGDIDYKLTKNGALEIDFNITSSTTASSKLLQESGVSFLLNKNITEARWLGFGPYSSYKGKQNLNNYGIFYKNENDIYFEGNKRGVDLVLLTDPAGNGILIVADSSNISFEKTDMGILFTYNTHITGLGSKFAETAYPVYSTTIGNLNGNFKIIPVVGNNWYALLNNLFGDPSQTGSLISPFIATNDTYPQKFNSITDGSSGCLPTVTASTFQIGNGPTNTIDDNLATRWSADGDGVFIIYEFCNVSLIDGIKISFQNGDTRVFTFDFLSSMDDVIYDTIQLGVTNSGTTSNMETYPITPTVAKFFQITGHGNSQNTWTSIQEVKFISQVVTTIKESEEKDEILSVFPNPSMNEVSVSIEGQIRKIELVSWSGKLIKEFIGNDAGKSISISGLSSGIYFLRITTDTNVYVKKIEKI
jgi:beta-galactosidase